MYKSLLTLSAFSVMATGFGARSETDPCAPTPPATCYPDNCKFCYCLGPENMMVNAPVCPKTCNGDFIFQVAGFYWNAHQDGMEYAIENNVINPKTNPTPGTAAIEELNNLVEARYKEPNFKWRGGFKVGIGYCTTCDGWDVEAIYTWYHGTSHNKLKTEDTDTYSLMPLWSAFAQANQGPLFANYIKADWKLTLNIVDFELGRSFWTSKYLALRPFVGIRIAYINQDWDLEHQNGSWGQFDTPFQQQEPFLNQVWIDNDFHGAGLRAGLSSEWNLGCGWAIYGNGAFSIILGRFNIDHNEKNTQALEPHAKIKVLETEDSFRAARAILDLTLGIQWHTMFCVCDCEYGFTGMVGWENHLFFHQNQMWRVNRIGQTPAPIVNNTGENVFFQRRGSLDTQGWTLTLKFEF